MHVRQDVLLCAALREIICSSVQVIVDEEHASDRTAHQSWTL